jgi:hypothetical protein
MAFIATVAALFTATLSVVFATWMIIQVTKK